MEKKDYYEDKPRKADIDRVKSIIKSIKLNFDKRGERPFYNLILIIKEFDNYYRLKIIDLLEKKDYYTKDLMKELGIKGYNNLLHNLNILEGLGVIKRTKEHNTQGQRVKISLDREQYLTCYEPFVVDLKEAHHI